MKILYLSASTFPSDSANSIQVMRMCEAFATLGHQVTLVGYQGDLLMGTREIFHRYWGLLLVLHGVTWLILYIPVMLCWDGLRECSTYLWCTKSISCLLRMGRFEKDGSGRWQSHRVLNHSNKVVVAHDAAKEPVCSSAPKSIEKKIAEARERGQMIAVYAGKISSEKSMQLLVEQGLCARTPFVYFVICGGSPEELDVWRKKLEVLPNVLLTGRLSPRVVGCVLRTADVCIAPFAKVGAGRVGWFSPLKLFEYMAAGKPLIVSDLPPLREIVDPEIGALCSPENILDWVGVLKDFYEHPEKRKTMGAKAYQRFLRYYRWEVRAQMVLEGL